MKTAQELAAWARTATAGEYLAEFDDGPEDDPQSLCGYSEPQIADMDAALARRGLILRTDDVGIVVEARS